MPNIEEQIRKAYEEGKFDNLPGQGKPLKLDENPLIDPEWRMAYHVLQSSGYSLPWIETRRELLEAWRITRESLLRTIEWKQAQEKQDPSNPLVENEWKRAKEEFLTRVEEINRRIFTYNLETVSSYFALNPIDPGRVINFDLDQYAENASVLENEAD